MRSPGRPPPRREVEREFWTLIATGVTSEEAAVAVGVSTPVGSRWFRHGGGMSPICLAEPSGRYLSFAEREEIALLRVQELGVREIGRRLGRPASTHQEQRLAPQPHRRPEPAPPAEPRPGPPERDLGHRLRPDQPLPDLDRVPHEVATAPLSNLAHPHQDRIGQARHPLAQQTRTVPQPQNERSTHETALFSSLLAAVPQAERYPDDRFAVWTETS